MGGRECGRGMKRMGRKKARVGMGEGSAMGEEGVEIWRQRKEGHEEDGESEDGKKKGGHVMVRR